MQGDDAMQCSKERKTIYFQPIQPIRPGAKPSHIWFSPSSPAPTSSACQPETQKSREPRAQNRQTIRRRPSNPCPGFPREGCLKLL